MTTPPFLPGSAHKGQDICGWWYRDAGPRPHVEVARPNDVLENRLSSAEEIQGRFKAIFTALEAVVATKDDKLKIMQQELSEIIVALAEVPGLATLSTMAVAAGSGLPPPMPRSPATLSTTRTPYL